jgi:hypothetical protein
MAMKKSFTLVVSFVIFLSPLSAYAAIDSLSGLTAAAQQLVSPGASATNTMHMDIVQVGADKHRFRWDGTPWRVDQGGTGLLASPVFGQLLIGDGLGGYELIATSSLGVIASAAGSDKEIQFNNAGDLGGLVALTWDDSLGELVLNTDGPGRFYVEVGDETEEGTTVLDIDGNSSSISFLNPYSAIWVGPSEGGDGSASVRLDFSQIQTEIGVPYKNVIFPDFLGEESRIGLLEADQIWSGGNTFSKGASATTTINLGEIGDATSHACFNTKNTDGQDVSFYIVGTSIVVENNLCQ